MLGLVAVGGSAVGVILSAAKPTKSFKLGSNPSPQNEEAIHLDQLAVNFRRNS